MRDFLPFLIVGLVSGSAYSLAAIGLVVTYRSSGILNLAHGAVAATAAYVFQDLRAAHGLPWPVAGLIVLGGLVPLLAVLLEAVFRPLVRAPEFLQIVASVGLLLALTGSLRVAYGNVALPFDAYLPTGTVEVVGVAVGIDQIITCAVVVAVVVGLQYLFRARRLGIALQAAVEDPDLLALTGTAPTRVRRWAWIIGVELAALAGLLLAPAVGLDTTILVLLVVQAFGAAAVGRFADIGRTYLGGLALGVTAALIARYLNSSPALQGLPASLPFIALFGALVIRRPPASEPVAARRSPSDEPWSSRTIRRALVCVAVTLGLAPFVAPERVGLLGTWMGLAIIFLSLSVLVRLSGQVSLCHATFAAVGATTFHHMTAGVGLPWPLGLLAAGTLTGLVAMLVAAPTVRLSGVYLALATFGFGILMERLAYPLAIMFGGNGVRAIPRPNGFQGDRAFFYVGLVVVSLLVYLVLLLRSDRFGRVLGALGDSPAGLESVGISSAVAKLLAFAAAAGIAGIGGAVYGASITSVQSFAGFGFLESLSWLTVVVIAGRGLIAPAIIGAGLLTVAPAYIGAAGSDNRTLAFGVAAIAVAIVSTGRFDFLGRLSAATAATAPTRARNPILARTDDGDWRSPLGLARGGDERR